MGTPLFLLVTNGDAIVLPKTDRPLEPEAEAAFLDGGALEEAPPHFFATLPARAPKCRIVGAAAITVMVPESAYLTNFAFLFTER